MLPHHTPQILSVGPAASVSQTASPAAGDEGPACLSCRKRKLRCSREQPSCSQCLRLDEAHECVYDQRRQKPGLKAGAIDNINRRLDLLERKLDSIPHEHDARRPADVDPGDIRGCLYHASLLLTNHLRDQAGSRAVLSCEQAPARGEGEPITQGHQPLAGVNQGDVSNPHDALLPNKKRRMESPVPQYDMRNVRERQLPNNQVLDRAITAYFATAHHWIPMLHERRFRGRLEDPVDSQNVIVLLHAIVAITLRHVDAEEIRFETQDIEEQIKASTDFVTLYVAENLSVESCQALIMLCFERMGSGEWQRAWTFLGALTRAVDYLQMTIEPEDRRFQPLLPALTILEDPKSPAEAEERKRVFWIAFLFDRLCSLTCGWSIEFTSDNVSRRLPCNGGIWRRNEESNTPYFGLWEKRQAKIGAPVAAYVSAHRASPGEQRQMAQSPNSANIRQLGAVAYRIEATESLSQVSSFFLQQNVDCSNRKELGDWLTRFKELDLRLVHWKQFLPDRWKESNVSRDAIVRMDPNLTLAHVTHNTSMILLHQHIAYPLPALKNMIKLPSTCSAETCELAAIETSAITSKYLRTTDEIMLNTEFVFCAWTAARVLLVHSFYYNTALNSEFGTLVQNLGEMSRRWRGYRGGWDHGSGNEAATMPKLDLAGTYALRLQEYRAMCERSHQDPGVIMEILGHSGASTFLNTKAPAAMSTSTPSATGYTARENGPSPLGTFRMPSRTARSEREEAVTPMHFPREPSDAPPTATPSPSQSRSQPNLANYYSEFPTEQPDNLMAMCDALMGQGFTNLDRVIPFDGTAFSFNPDFMPEIGSNAYGNF